MQPRPVYGGLFTTVCNSPRLHKLLEAVLAPNLQGNAAF